VTDTIVTCLRLGILYRHPAIEHSLVELKIKQVFDIIT